LTPTLLRFVIEGYRWSAYPPDVLARTLDSGKFELYEWYAESVDEVVDISKFREYHKNPGNLFVERNSVNMVCFKVVNNVATTITTSDGIHLPRFIGTVIYDKASNRNGITRVEQNERVDGVCFVY